MLLKLNKYVSIKNNWSVRQDRILHMMILQNILLINQEIFIIQTTGYYYIFSVLLEFDYFLFQKLSVKMSLFLLFFFYPHILVKILEEKVWSHCPLEPFRSTAFFCIALNMHDLLQFMIYIVLSLWLACTLCVFISKLS